MNPNAPDADDDPPDRPQTEAEADKMQAQSDRLMDRIVARMDREGDAADFGKVIEEELDRARRERGEPELTPEQEAERAGWVEEMNAAGAEAVEAARTEAWKGEAGDDSDDPFGDKHPLSARAFEFSLRLMREPEARGWIDNGASAEHPVVVLIASVTSAGAKLAGALNGREDWPPPVDFCAGTIVRLKKAANYWDDARLAVESCREGALVDVAWLAEVVVEIAALASATDGLIAELRSRLEDGV